MQVIELHEVLNQMDARTVMCTEGTETLRDAYKMAEHAGRLAVSAQALVNYLLIEDTRTALRACGGGDGE